ncbi:MAG: hypothetical protein NTV58_18095 [Deltaproteobacteria bacterium]|nr:hypothetical protein [Deltaproteobacteria bacterium]
MNAQTSDTAASDQLKKIKDMADAQTATANAQMAAANAQKAQAEAEVAALKAKIGEIPASGYTGATELGAGAGSAEAVLLSAIAVNDIAKKFAERMKKDIPIVGTQKVTKIILTASTTVPDFQALMVFSTQYASLQIAIAAARKEAEITHATDTGVKLESVAAIGLGLAAINNILAFAKTDFKYVGFDVTATDSMLLNATARHLKAENATVEIPSLYLPDAMAISNPGLKMTSQVLDWSKEAKRNIKLFEAAQARLEKQSADAPSNQELKDKLQKVKDSLAIWKAVSDAIDAWVKQVTTADDKGMVPLATIIRQSAIKQKLDGGASLVIIQLHKLVGTGYTKKNLWSSLGANPFFMAGGAVASYVAFDGPNGAVLSSMFLPVHGGYHSVSEIEEVVNNANK